MTSGRRAKVIRVSERRLKVRLKTKKNRTVSQKRWLERQLNDPYVARAKREGLRSRAAYKLIEVDDKYHLLKGGARVVDLGAAPGGWSEVAAKRVGAAEGRGRVVAIDVLDMKPVAGVEFMQLDFLDPAAPGRLRAALDACPLPVGAASARPTGRWKRLVVEAAGHATALAPNHR